MIFEIKVTGARRVGKTTIMNKLLYLLEKEAADYNARPTIEYIQGLKSSTTNGIPAETVKVKITTFAEQTAFTYVNARGQIPDEEYVSEFLKPLRETS